MAARTKAEEDYYNHWGISSDGLDGVLDHRDGEIDT